MPSFTLNDKSYEITNGSLLDQMLNQNVIIQHNCKDGRCANCEVFSIDLNQKVLACQTTPKLNDKFIVMNLADLALPKVKNFPVKVTSVQFIGNFFKVFLKYSKKLELEFNNGQYLDLSILGTTRSYSIYKNDNIGKTIEILCSSAINGLASDYLRSSDAINSILRVDFPKGTFQLKKSKLNQKHFFVCTGTGISPVLNIVNNHKGNNLKYKIFWGVKEACKFSKHIKDLLGNDIEIYYSRSPSNDTGKSGRLPISEIIDESFNDKKWYVCGNPEMIKDFENIMITRGLDTTLVMKDPFI